MPIRKLKKFNINEYVYFRPTKYGLEIMNLKLEYRKGDHKIDKESGMYYLQLHEYMHCFGDASFVGNFSFVVNSEIYFDEKYLGDI